MDLKELSLKMHREWAGKLEISSRIPVDSREALSVAYTPGVAAPCLAIAENPDQSYVYTRRWNTVAVVTDGSAVLGLGDIGPEAAMPVMEGKCVLFKSLGGVDAIPLCLRSKDIDTIVQTVALLAGSFGGINLEDISAPRCFEIERRLKQVCDIPVFHDDQHGTAVVVAAALLNAVSVTRRELTALRAVVNGAGAAGIAVARILLSLGIQDVVLCDRRGALTPGAHEMNAEQSLMAETTNPMRRAGFLADVLIGADLFIGVSAPNLVTPDMVASMADNPILFAMANPDPEIIPDAAKAAGAAVVGTGRSDFPNQINNVLAFPGIFRGVLDSRASEINDAMKMAAAHALAGMVPKDALSPENILPDAWNPLVGATVASAVAHAARDTGVARS